MSLRQLTTPIAFSLATLVSGCDTNQRVELAERQYEGKVTITLTQQEILMDKDFYQLEVTDSTGTVIAYIKTNNKPYRAQLVVKKDNGEEGLYDLNERGIVQKEFK